MRCATGAFAPVTPDVFTNTESVPLAVGYYHACRVQSGKGSVSCWGYNPLAQLGQSTPQISSTPIPVESLSEDVVQIAAGGQHSCAVLSSGSLLCWGSNSFGESGVEPNASQPKPVAITGIGPVVSVALGEQHSCALSRTGAVLCWGRNKEGQLGVGTTSLVRTSVPQNVEGLSSGVIALAAHSHHTCALMIGGSVKCWGANTDGQTGTGIPGNVYAPAPVVGITDAVSVAVGLSHSCIIRKNGSVMCWGVNDYGALGDGTITNSPLPVASTAVTTPLTSVAAGAYFTCGTTLDGSILCWGINVSGTLGNASTTPSALPVEVVGLPALAMKLALGFQHACAYLQNGEVWCWGSNSQGQIVDGGSPGARTSPVLVTK